MQFVIAHLAALVDDGEGKGLQGGEFAVARSCAPLQGGYRGVIQAQFGFGDFAVPGNAEIAAVIRRCGNLNNLNFGGTETGRGVDFADFLI